MSRKQELENILDSVKYKNRSEYERLRAFAVSWVRVQMRPFTSEDLKAAYLKENKALQQPNVYGVVMNHLSREKRIYKNGYNAARLKTAHCRVLTVWISHEYRLKQQANSTAPYKNQTNLKL